MKYSAAHPQSTHLPHPISQNRWTRTTWSRSTISSGNSLWRGTKHSLTQELPSEFLVYPRSTCEFVCLQAVSSVSDLLLEGQLLPEAGAGAVSAGRRPAEGHHTGGRQRQRDFHLLRPVGFSCRESGATRGPPPPAGEKFSHWIG